MGEVLSGLSRAKRSGTLLYKWTVTFIIITADGVYPLNNIDGFSSSEVMVFSFLHYLFPRDYCSHPLNNYRWSALGYWVVLMKVVFNMVRPYLYCGVRAC